MKNGFVMIGDAKYELYFNVTALMTGLSLLVLFSGIVSGKADLKKERSYAEIMAFFFVLVTLVSVFLGMDDRIATWGYTDWHMGGITQLMTILGFFVMKNWTENDRWSWIFLGISSLIVCGLSVANRHGADPLNVYDGMAWLEWNRRNLIATIGNINWACCFMAIGVPLLLWVAWTLEDKYRILGYVGAWIAIAGIWLQGSDSGILDLAVVVTVLLWISADRWDRLLRTIEIITLIPLFWSVYSFFQFKLVVPVETDIEGKFYTLLWLIPLAVCLIIRYGAGKLAKSGGEACWLKKPIRIGIVMIVLVGAGIFALCQISDGVWTTLGKIDVLRFNDSWGSLRGGVWKASVRCFGEMGISQKLFGAGPDCYALLLESMGTRFTVKGQWANAVYANAHNEFLTMLINEGILGVVTYFGIYASVALKLTSDKRMQPKSVLGIMILASYLGNQFFSFQQIISTPVMLMILGIMDAENLRLQDDTRNAKIRKNKKTNKKKQESEGKK